MYSLLRRAAYSLLLVLACSAPSFSAEVSVTLGIGEWPPYFSAELQEHGMFAHIVSAAFAKEGIATHYRFYPWKRALKLAEDGTLDGSPGWVRNDERDKTLLFSAPVIISREVLFFRQAHPVQFSQIADLKGKTIAIVNGYTYGKEFDSAIAAGNLSTHVVNSDAIGMNLVLAGRVDALAVNYDVGYALLNTHFSAAQRALISTSNTPLSEKESRLAVGKKHPHAQQLIDTFNQGLAKLQTDGSLQRILKAAEQGAYKANP